MPFDLPPEYEKYHLTIADAVTVFAALSGFHYNLTNLFAGLSAAQDKIYAIGCMLPYAQFFLMLYCSSVSRFWPQYPYYFLCMNGLYLTYVTGIFNLNSTASMRFNYLFAEPIVYLLIVYLDYTLAISTETNQLVLGLYAAFVLSTFIKYIIFMRSVVNQLTKHLNIPFIRVKEKKSVKSE